MSTLGLAERDTGPWYRHPWPWFIVLLLMTAVVASLWTVYIAFANRDSLVRNDYYDDGAAINRRLELEGRAAVRGLTAEFTVAPGAPRADAQRLRGLRLTLAGDAGGATAFLQLELSHPTDAARDQTIVLTRGPDGAYHGSTSRDIDGRWYASLTPGTGSVEGWRLSQAIRISGSLPTQLGQLDAKANEAHGAAREAGAGTP